MFLLLCKAADILLRASCQYPQNVAAIVPRDHCRRVHRTQKHVMSKPSPHHTTPTWARNQNACQVSAPRTQWVRLYSPGTAGQGGPIQPPTGAPEDLSPAKAMPAQGQFLGPPALCSAVLQKQNLGQRAAADAAACKTCCFHMTGLQASNEPAAWPHTEEMLGHAHTIKGCRFCASVQAWNMQGRHGICTCFSACWAWTMIGEVGDWLAGAITTQSSSEPEEYSETSCSINLPLRGSPQVLCIILLSSSAQP